MKKILVLEDEENIRSFVVINLKRAGYETVEAGTGEEALAQLRRNPDIHWIEGQKERDFSRAVQVSTEILAAAGVS